MSESLKLAYAKEGFISAEGVMKALAEKLGTDPNAMIASLHVIQGELGHLLSRDAIAPTWDGTMKEHDQDDAVPDGMVPGHRIGYIKPSFIEQLEPSEAAVLDAGCAVVVAIGGGMAIATYETLVTWNETVENEAGQGRGDGE
jgi:hypothetical protein